MRRIFRRPRRSLVIAVVLAGIAAVTGVALHLAQSQQDVSNADVEFVARNPTIATSPVPEPGRHPADDTATWSHFGYDKARTHVLPLASPLRPPFREVWAERGRVLLEFTPVLCGRSLYLLKNNGALYKISRRTGAVLWKRKLGVLAASSPACGGGSVYVVLLSRGRSTDAGRVVALRRTTGTTRWSRKLPSRAESSPLLDRGRLIFGSEDGTVYCLRARDGAIRWRYRARGAVKSALALADGKLFFGDYSGRFQAIRRRDGKKVWIVNTRGAGLGLASGQFYSTPAVAYGRVYVGNTDGNMYSFAARNGALAWRTKTGNYVYASPAVGEAGSGPPTVWFGSYDGRFYALNARTGARRWTRALGRKISGGATAIGDLVFVSDLGTKSSWALAANTGKTIWKTRRGAFHAAISDGRRIYFNGYSSIFALQPKGTRFASSPAKTRKRR